MPDLPRRRPAASLGVLAVCLALAAAAPASAAIVINEVESDGGGGPDFVELKNTGAVPVDIGGYVLRDSNDGNSTTIAAGTVLAAGGYHVADALDFGLSSGDAARLFTTSGLASQIDGFSWTAHAGATFGRCPDGVGALVHTNRATPGGANDCRSTTAPPAAVAWPGGAEVALADAAGVFGPNLSGLAYQPSGTGARGVLWAVRNGPSTLFRLLWDGAKWVPDTANGWSAGKQLVYPDGSGVPDAEGVTLAGEPNALYVSTERNDTPAEDDTSRPSVLRFDSSAPGAALTATREWPLAADLPGLDSNGGLEAVTWVPDAVLVAKGFRDEATGAAYAPGTYANHGTGLFLVGVEASGQVIAYALNQATGAFTRVAAIASGFPTVMDLHFEAETSRVWAVCDDTCGGQSTLLEIAQSGPSTGRFVPVSTVDRPAGMANLNNEGFTIAPQAECVSGRKPVFWADDSSTGGHALRSGTLSCTAPAAPDPGPGPVVVPPPVIVDPPPAFVLPPAVVAPPPVLPPAPPVRPGRDRTAPSLRATLKLTRRTGRLRATLILGEKATVTLSATVRRSSRARARTILKASSRFFTAGKRTVTLTLSKKVRAALRRGEKVTLTAVARDAAGNRTTRRVTLRVI